MPAGEAKAKLDALGTEAFLELTLDGATFTDIAKQVGVSRWAILKWLAADEKRYQKAQHARTLSAAAHEELAEADLRKARNEFQLAKARELAHHRRWRASKLDPANYSSRTELTGARGAPLVPDPFSPAEEKERESDALRRLAFLLYKAGNSERSAPPAEPPKKSKKK